MARALRPPATLTALLFIAFPTTATPQNGGSGGSSVYTYRPEPIKLAEIGVPIHPAVAPSPDGRFFAVLQTRPNPVLWIVPADGGAPFAYREMWAAYNPRWAPSGNRIGFVAGIGPPRVWTIEVDPESGRPVDPPRLLYRAEVNAYAFAPDGERVAFVPRRTTAAGASEIHIIEWESRRVRFLLRESGLIYRLDWSPDGKFVYYGLAADDPDVASHSVVRASVRGASKRTVAETGEFLGLSTDGLWLLNRPRDFEAIRANALQITTTGGAPVLRVSVPRGLAPTWGATSNALVQVRSNTSGDEIIAIPSPVRWPIVRW
jgi:Tol biopolymer transport system component